MRNAVHDHVDEIAPRPSWKKGSPWKLSSSSQEWDPLSCSKWLLRTSDETLSAADLAAAYKQLYQVERGWRDMKGALRLRPVFHHREDRIRAHAGLCWLALLLIRVVENATGDSWRCVRDALERLHLVTLETGAGRVAKRSLSTPGQRRIFAALELPERPAFSDFEVAQAPA